MPGGAFGGPLEGVPGVIGAVLCLQGPPRAQKGVPQGLQGGPPGASREPLGASGGLQSSFAKRNLTVKADGAAGGSGRLQEALRGSGRLLEAPSGSVKRNLTGKAHGSARRDICSSVHNPPNYKVQFSNRNSWNFLDS